MSAEQGIAFVLFALVAAITPGPSNMILTTTGAAMGVRSGLPTLLGVTLGMGLLMFLVTFGFGSLLWEHPLGGQGLRWVGASFLLWLSWKISTAEQRSTTGGERAIGFWRGAALQWVNPKSWLVTASAVSAYLQPSAGSALVQSLTLATLFVLVALPSCGLWLVFGATLQRFLRSEQRWRAFSITMGLLLAGSIVLLFTE